ncbi:hypothetical protein [Cyanothece sp. BG0011]|uniref:hypothetical protein n=1 Tax=Cyanothece sp. BG0011 TaxID=2082950 RepID=UPI000D1EFB0E|nr:hypothetical protein [Cyanothece sp. BG0011]
MIEGLNEECNQLLSSTESVCHACGTPIAVIEQPTSSSMNHISYSYEENDGEIKEEIKIQLSDSMIDQLFGQ